LRIRPALARRFLRLSGWALEGKRPAVRGFVLIAAPHTTNWDLLYFLACAWAFGIRPSWTGKHTLFRGPLGPVMRWLGGIPVDRSRPGGLVGELALVFQREPDLVLTVPPEGTRGRAKFWKSGFYQVALAAQVPIVMGYLDYGRRRGGLGPVLAPGLDLRSDMDAIRAFYVDKRGKYPELFGEVRLREETLATGD
jgi:1-acyl-sn-glycerol-3-phosphate acyltransferase